MDQNTHRASTNSGFDRNKSIQESIDNQGTNSEFNLNSNSQEVDIDLPEPNSEFNLNSNSQDVDIDRPAPNSDFLHRYTVQELDLDLDLDRETSSELVSNKSGQGLNLDRETNSGLVTNNSRQDLSIIGRDHRAQEHNTGTSTQFMHNALSRLPFLNGDNFWEWKEKFLLTLGCMNFGLALRMDEPPLPTESCTEADRALYDRWEESNRSSLTFIKAHVSKSIRDSIPEYDKVKDFMQAIEEKFASFDKPQANVLINKLLTMKYDDTKGMREHITEMKNIAAQLKSLEVKIPESFLIRFILNSLPAEYEPFKSFYKMHKDKWSINELLTMCLQEKGRLKQMNLSQKRAS